MSRESDQQRLWVGLNIDLPPAWRSDIERVDSRISIYDRSELERSPDALERVEVLLTHHAPVQRLSSSRSLRWIQTLGAGVEWLLEGPLRKREDLLVTNTSGIHAQALAEHVFAMLLMFARGLHLAPSEQARRSWNPDRLRGALRPVAGQTLGILGLGAIGRRLAPIGAALGMRVIGLKRASEDIPWVEKVYEGSHLIQFLRQTDYLINILPLTPQTHGYLGEAEFNSLRRGAFVINIGRGGTMDTAALLNALGSGQLGGAGLDVTDPEPLPAEHPLWGLENVIISPHYGGAHEEYLSNTLGIFVANLRRYLGREPLLNQVDLLSGY